MSGEPKLLFPGQVSVIEARTAISVWVGRAAHYADQAVANAERAHQQMIEKRLDKPSRTWTAREVLRSYRATADGDRRYREEADVLTLHGYTGWLETRTEGRPLGGRVLLALRLGAFGDRRGARGSAGRTVTWTKELA